jgi:hypothetical protein
MLFGGVVPLATTSGSAALIERETVNGWAVSPRNSGPVFVRNSNRYVTSGRASPFVSTLRLYLAFGENVYQFGPRGRILGGDHVREERDRARLVRAAERVDVREVG